MKKILLILATMLFCVSAEAASVVVTGVGNSERNAVHDAMRRAIEQTLGAHITSRTYVENAQLINDRINTQTAGFIASYEVLQKEAAYGMWTVKIRAEVNDERLQSDLLSRLQKKAVVGANMGDPRIGVVALDEYGREDNTLYALIVEQLNLQGFSRLIDLQQVNASVRQRIARADYARDTELKKMLATEFPVDYLVTAQAKTRVRRDPNNFNRRASGKAQAEIAARMINVNNGEIIFAGAQTASAIGKNAVSEANKRAAVHLATQLGKAAIEKAATTEQHISVVITGGALGGLEETYDKLASLPGVVNVYPRNRAFGNIEADIDFLGTAFDLAQTLEQAGIRVKELGSEYILIGR